MVRFFERTPPENSSEYTTINVTPTDSLSKHPEKETHVLLRLVLARAGVIVTEIAPSFYKGARLS